MKVVRALRDYISHKRALGYRFQSDAVILKAFGRSVGALALHRIGRREVRSYLDGTGSVTTFWHRKWTGLRGFYRFALARRWVGQSPLPPTPPKVSAPFVPYIFRRTELKRLLTGNGPGTAAQPVPQASLRMLLILLYGAGLRLSEALRLEFADVDWETGVITVRDTKFFKTRLVPLAPELADRLRHHLRFQRRLRPGHDPTASVLVNRRGGRVTRSQAETAFRRLRERLKIQRPGGTRPQPRLHDLRQSFAVHRLVQCYRQGAETPRLLHGLSIYLGHRNLSATQRYLTMTPELLELASQRFEAYTTVHSNRP